MNESVDGMNRLLQGVQLFFLKNTNNSMLISRDSTSEYYLSYSGKKTSCSGPIYHSGINLTPNSSR